MLGWRSLAEAADIQPSVEILAQISVAAGSLVPPFVTTFKEWLTKVQSVDQRMRLGMRCRLSPTADVPSHTSGAAMPATEIARLGLK